MYIYIVMPAAYCFLERCNDRILKFHINNFSYFQLSASLL